MKKINENLLAGDLSMLVRKIFEIDSFSSKMGEDADIVVLSFTVDRQEPAIDLVTFIENGFEFVLDADISPGELDDGKYKVFVEIERNRRVAEQIFEILIGLKKLTGNDEFYFRYYKSFQSIPATIENLKSAVPINKNEYKTKIDESYLNNSSNFFNKSFLENISVDDDTIIFQKMYAEPLKMKIKGYGTEKEIYDSIPGNIMLEQKSIAEVMFLTKYLGNYNITKIGNTFVLENQGYALALERA